MLPPWSNISINRAQGEAGQQQNDRHLYYKPQTLQQRPGIAVTNTHPANPTSQSLWLLLEQGSPSVSRSFSHLFFFFFFARLVIKCFLLLPSFMSLRTSSIANMLLFTEGQGQPTEDASSHCYALIPTLVLFHRN